MQKLLLFDSTKEDSSVLRQHFSELSRGKAHVIKMHSNTIDIVPLNASKSGGLRILLDHLGITKDVRIHSHSRTIFTVHFCALFQSVLEVLTLDFSLMDVVYSPPPPLQCDLDSIGDYTRWLSNK
jgi:hypothetical protein